MDDPNLILTITAANISAENALRLLHNRPRQVPFRPGRHDVGDLPGIPSPGSTPGLGSSEDKSYRLRLSFNQRPKNIRQGFVFGNDPRTCDVLLGNSKGISREHSSITFDTQGRLVLRDRSRFGTAVSYDGNPAEVRRTFTWILFRDYKTIKVYYTTRSNKDTAIILELEEHGTCRAAYEANLSAYLQDSHNALPALALLDVHSQVTTALASQPLSPRERPIYLEGRRLGSGTFGTVYRVTDVSTGALYAAKELKNKSRFEMEVEILKGICHENIVRFVDLTAENPPRLIMEYLPLGSLASQHSKAPITRTENVQILRQGLQAFVYLHARNITHRDVKPENILVRSRGLSFHLKLANFGSSKDLCSLNTFCGSRMYMAPEMWSNGNYNNRVDIWSLGVVVLQYAGGLPRHITAGGREEYSWRQVLSKAAISMSYTEADKPISVLKKMLQMDPKERPSASDCLLDAQELQDAHSGSVTPTERHTDGHPPPVPVTHVADVDSGTTRFSESSKRRRSSSDTTIRQLPSSKRLLTAKGSSIRRPSHPTSDAEPAHQETPLTTPSNAGFHHVDLAGRPVMINDPEAAQCYPAHLHSNRSITHVSESPAIASQSSPSGDRIQHGSTLQANTDLKSTTDTVFSQSSLRSTESAEKQGVTYPDELRSITNISGCSVPHD